MSNSDYNSTDYIKNTRERINEILKPINNDVYVFDFGHYILKEAHKNSYYFKSIIFGSESYKNQLFPNNKINTDADAYTFFESNLRQIANVPLSDNQFSQEDSSADVAFTLGPEIITTNKKFETTKFISILQQLKINGCIFIYAKKVGNYQSGVWLVLKNRIEQLIDGMICFGFKNECTVCQEKNNTRKCIYENDKGYFHDKTDLKTRIDEVFQELDNLLINELVFNAESYTKQVEAQRIAFEKFNKKILQAHSHTIFNCIPSLDVQNLREKLSPLLLYYSDSQSEENKYLSDIDEELKMLHIRLNELNYVTHAALESPFSTKEKLFKEQNLKQLIDIIAELTKGRCLPYIIGLETINFNPSFYDKECQDAFTVLWNAWNNALKHSPNKSFVLKVYENQNELVIEFTNHYNGTLNKENLAMLRNESDPPVYTAGIPIIKHLCNILNWRTDADDSNNTFKIEFKIKFNIYGKAN